MCHLSLKRVLAHLFNSNKSEYFRAGLTVVMGHGDNDCVSSSDREGKLFCMEPFVPFWQRSSCGCILLGSVVLTFTTGSMVELEILS